MGWNPFLDMSTLPPQSHILIVHLASQPWENRMKSLRSMFSFLTARTGPPVAAIMVDNCIYGVDFTHCVIERVFSMW